MVTSVIALALSALWARPFINGFGMNGVSFAIILAYVIHVAACGTVIFFNLNHKGKRN